MTEVVERSATDVVAESPEFPKSEHGSLVPLKVTTAEPFACRRNHFHDQLKE
jgi:hypothetical protein